MNKLDNVTGYNDKLGKRMNIHQRPQMNEASSLVYFSDSEYYSAHFNVFYQFLRYGPWLMR